MESMKPDTNNATVRGDLGLVLAELTMMRPKNDKAATAARIAVNMAPLAL
jgi:hypothetical protein